MIILNKNPEKIRKTRKTIKFMSCVTFKSMSLIFPFLFDSIFMICGYCYMNDNMMIW